jgi:GTP cyclohydrolase III
MVTYVIIDTTEITDENSVIDFYKLINRNAAMLRYSLDGSKALVKYNGDQPSFLSGKTTYTYEEIKVEMSKSDWHKEEEE